MLLAPKAKPPVCKILDYGRYHFEQQKKAKEAKEKTTCRGNEIITFVSGCRYT